MNLAMRSSEDWLAWTPDGRHAGTPSGIATLAAIRSGTHASPLSSIGKPLSLAELFTQVLK